MSVKFAKSFAAILYFLAIFMLLTIVAFWGETTWKHWIPFLLFFFTGIFLTSYSEYLSNNDYVWGHVKRYQPPNPTVFTAMWKNAVRTKK